jgi:heptosyltransferase-2
MRNKSPDRSGHFVFLCEGQLGDLLILTPAVRAVKDVFPAVKITAVILQRRSYDGSERSENIFHSGPFSGTSSVLADNPNVDHVLEIDRSHLRSLWGFKRLAAEMQIVGRLRALKPDVIICTFPQDRFAIWAYLSGAGMRIGQSNQKFAWLLTHKPDIEKEVIGVRDYYLTLAESAGARSQSIDTDFSIPEDADIWADNLFRSFTIPETQIIVAVHPGASGPYKIWPPEYFARVIDQLQNGMGCRVILCGTAFDEDVVAEIRRYVQTTVTEIKFDHNVARFAAILKRSRLCISNDSGPRHLAVAVGTPSVALMMRDQDRQWQIYQDDENNIVLLGEKACPACDPSPCRHIIPENANYGSLCIRTIPVERVLHAVQMILNRK